MPRSRPTSRSPWCFRREPNRTVSGADARVGQIVNHSCGTDVDACTVAITIDDGTASASADFTVFLVLREDGWKVWGVY